MKQSNFVRTIIFSGSFLLQLNTLCVHSRGAAGDVDLSFDPGSGLNGPVYSLVVQSDGKALIGGDFTTVKNLARSRIARLNADGSGDATFNPGIIASGPVSSITLHTAGKVLFASKFGGYTDPYYYEDYQVARLNSDGSLDNYAFFLRPWEERYGGSINSIFVQSNGKVILGGYFLVEGPDGAGGGRLLAYPRIIRINPDGALDSSFALSNPPEYGGSIEAVAAQPDGKVLVGGGFYIGTNSYTFARLNTNGSLDKSFNPNGGSGVLAVATQSDGKVLIGGYISTLNGTNLSGIIRLQANGSLDSSFNPGTGANGVVRAIALQPDGKVLVGGEFTTFNGPNRNHIARLNADGSLDGSFNPGTGANGNVSSIALQPDGNVLLGGDFATVNNVARRYVARLYGDSLPPSLNIARSNSFMIVSWAVTGLNFQLQETTNLALPSSWSSVGQPGVTNAGQISVNLPTAVGSRFFRLESH